MIALSEMDNINILGHENIFLNEDEHIKSYLRCICAFNGLSRTLSPILHAFCSYIEFNDEYDCKVIHITGSVIEEICEMTDLKSARINKALRDIVSAGIFTKVPHKRAMYIVNPCIVTTEELKNLKELKANINFSKGCFEICLQ